MIGVVVVGNAGTVGDGTVSSSTVGTGVGGAEGVGVGGASTELDVDSGARVAVVD